jgi:hypothetical protein
LFCVSLRISFPVSVDLGLCNKHAPGNPPVAVGHVFVACVISRLGTYLRLEPRQLQLWNAGDKLSWPTYPGRGSGSRGQGPARSSLQNSIGSALGKQSANVSPRPAAQGGSVRMRAAPVSRAAPSRARPPDPRATEGCSTPPFWPPGAAELRAGKARGDAGPPQPLPRSTDRLVPSPRETKNRHTHRQTHGTKRPATRARRRD